jgi:hypothetical protein
MIQPKLPILSEFERIVKQRKGSSGLSRVALEQDGGPTVFRKVSFSLCVTNMTTTSTSTTTRPTPIPMKAYASHQHGKKCPKGEFHPNLHHSLFLLIAMVLLPSASFVPATGFPLYIF